MIFIQILCLYFKVLSNYLTGNGQIHLSQILILASISCQVIGLICYGLYILQKGKHMNRVTGFFYFTAGMISHSLFNSLTKLIATNKYEVINKKKITKTKINLFIYLTVIKYLKIYIL